MQLMLIAVSTMVGVIRAPEIYQTHSFVVKVNRKGQHQDRVLVLSNLYIYNVEVTHCPTAIKEVKVDPCSFLNPKP